MRSLNFTVPASSVRIENVRIPLDEHLALLDRFLSRTLRRAP